MVSEELRGAVPLSHLFLRERVRPGDRVVDATCGNGRDTLVLAGLVGPAGRVWGFDIQETALYAAGTLLEKAGHRDRVELVHAGHERLAEFVSAPVTAVVFNLGYLPGGNRECVTRPRATTAAAGQAAGLLAPGGFILMVLYTGHDGGPEEAAAVESWAAALPPKEYHVWNCRQMNRSCAAPYVILVEKAR